MTGNDVNTQSLHLKNGRFVSLTVGLLAAVVMALMFFVVCWLLADAFIVLAGQRLLSTNFLTNTGQFSLRHFLDVIDGCGLTSAVDYRIYAISLVTALFGLLAGNLVRKGIAGGAWPSLLISLGLVAFSLLFAILLTAIVARYLPTANPQASVACILEKNAPSF